MSNKLLIVITAIIILVGAIFIFSSNKSKITQTESPDENTYSLEEVAQHNSETDCWMAIEGKVYDVSEFIGKHPGGKAILNGCGKDATTLFNERPTNNMGAHPAQAKAELQSYEIGNLSP